jgi:hypothetical protein
LTATPTTIHEIIKDNDSPQKNGGVSYWAGGAVDFTASLMRTDMPVTASTLTNFRNITYDSASKQLTAELWATPSEIGQNFNLSFLLPSTVSATYSTADSLSGWTVAANTNKGVFSIAGISATNSGAAAPIKYLSLSFTGVDVTGIPSLISGKIGDANVISEDLFQNVQLKSSGGQFSFDAISGSYASQVLSISVSGAASSVDSRDALMALKIANGSLTNASLSSPLQIASADVNKSGSVTTMDAWLILRAVVGYEVPNIGDLGFVQSTADLSAIDRFHTQPTGLNYLDLTSPSVAVTAYLLGDVNGSYFFHV